MTDTNHGNHPSMDSSIDDNILDDAHFAASLEMHDQIVADNNEALDDLALNPNESETTVIVDEEDELGGLDAAAKFQRQQFSDSDESEEESISPNFQRDEQSPIAASPDLDEEPENLDLMDKLMQGNNLMKVFIGAIALVVVGIALFFWVVVSQAGSSSPVNGTSNGQPFPIEEPQPTVSELGLPQQTSSGDIIFDGPGASATTITDSDVIVAGTIEEYKSLVSQLNSQLNASQTSLNAARNDLKQIPLLKEELGRTKSALTTMTERHTKVQAQLNQLNEQMEDAKASSVTLTRKISLRDTQIAQLKAQLESERSENNAEVAEINQQLDTMTALLQTMSQNSNALRQEQESRNLADLRWVGLDPVKGQGLFQMMRDGKFIKDITLEPGERLIGRGVVTNVDAYGCVYLSGDKVYEPINGRCLQ